MTRTRRLGATLALMGTFVLAAASQAPGYYLKTSPSSNDQQRSEVKGELIVAFEQGVSDSAARGAIAGTGASVGRKLRLGNLYLVDAGSSKDAVASSLRNRGDVEYVQPNFRYLIAASVAGAPGPLSAPPLATDPLFPQQWDLHNTGQQGGTPDADIDAPEAWQRIGSNLNQSSAPVVAVLDTGVDYTHPELANTMWSNPGETGPGAQPGVDDDGNGFVDDINGVDTVRGDGDPMDDNSHGTHVAGTVAARANNGAVGAGVAAFPGQARIMAVKMIGWYGNGVTSDAIDGYAYAIENGADVISNSWGGYVPVADPALMTAVDAAADAGIVQVFAAGNESLPTPILPGLQRPPGSLRVAATTRFDGRASFSNYNPALIEIAAPGQDIISPVPTSSGLVGTQNTLLFTQAYLPEQPREFVRRSLQELGAGAGSSFLLVDDDGLDNDPANQYHEIAQIKAHLEALGHTGIQTTSVPFEGCEYQTPYVIDLFGFVGVYGNCENVNEPPPGRPGPSAAEMAGKVVIWYLRSDDVNSLVEQDRAAIRQHVANGGKIMIIGQGVARELGHETNLELAPIDNLLGVDDYEAGKDPAFLREVLGAKVVMSYIEQDFLHGQPGTAFAGYEVEKSGCNIPVYCFPDGVLPVAGGRAVGTFDAFDSYSGTSMAAPHVSGAAALVLAAHPTFSAAQVVQAIEAGADRLVGQQIYVQEGRRLNADGALREASLIAGG